MSFSLRDAVPRSGVLASFIFAAPWLSQSVAQAAEPGTGEDSVEEVLVTGSRIKGIAPVGSNVITASPVDLAKAPATNVVDMLRRIPQVSGYGTNEQMKLQAGPNASGSNATRVDVINLRGIGASSTLVLFDGVRVPAGGLGGTQIDMTSLPLLALERVEVVADGASAIYGSDAVAGVINFVPKRRAKEWETRAQFGFADGINTLNVSQSLGGDWGSGGWVLAAQHMENGHLNGTEREYYRSDLRQFGGQDLRSTQCNPGNIVVNNVTYAIPEGGVTPATANQLVPNTINRCELYRTGDIIAQQQRDSAYFNLDQDIGERFNVFVRGIFADRDYSADDFSQGSTTQVTRFTVPSTNAYFVRPPGTTGAVAVDYYYGPDQGRLTFNGTSRYLQFNSGLGADLWGDWQANLKASWSRTKDSLVAYNFLAAQQTAALASNNPAVALNPFGPNDPSKVGYIFTNLFNPFARYTMHTGTLDFGGSLFALPGGDVRLAFGYDYTHFDILTGNYRGDVRAPVYMESPSTRTVNALFAEFFVPVFGGENELPGLRRLDLSVAGRSDDYSDVGRTTNPKYGINWSPVEGLLFKGSYGTSFKAPGTNNLSVTRPGSALIVYSATDSRSPTGTSIGLNINAGNPDIEPEEAKTYSISAEIKPVWTPSLTFNATYFSIETSKSILAVPAASALTNPLYAPFVIRNPTQAQIDEIIARFPELLVQGGSLATVPTFVVDTRPQNSGGFRLEGIDVATSYDLPTSYGDFYFLVNGTWNTKWEVKLTDEAAPKDLLNRLNNILKFRGRGEVGWRQGAWTAELDINYTNRYTNDQVVPSQQVDADVTFDVRASYTFGDDSPTLLQDLEITLGARNVLDEDPPFVDVQSGMDGSVASALGRVISLTIDKRW